MTHPTKHSLILPLLLSLLVHIALVMALWLYRPTLPKPPQKSLETSLVGQEELLAIQEAIRANAQAQQSLQKSQPPSKALQISQQLAQKEALFQAQMQKFANEQEALAQAQMQAFESQLASQQAQEHEELQEARQAFADKDELQKQNQKQFDTPSSAKDTKDAKDGDSTSPISLGKEGDTQSGSNAHTQSLSKSDKQNIQGAVARHIKSYWTPMGEIGTRLNTHITVDADGKVLSVKVSGGNEAQRQALEQAIYASSPITPIIGTAFRSFSPSFVIE